MSNQTPFLNIGSFREEGESAVAESAAPSIVTGSPFLSLYETEEGELVTPETEEYLAFLNELYNEEFDEALSALVDEARVIYETQFPHGQGGSQNVGYQAERLLEQHFAPLAAEAEALLETLAREFGERGPNTLNVDEIDTIVDRSQPSIELAPNFEEFLGGLKKLARRALKAGVKLAKKGISAAAKLGLGPILKKLKVLIKPLLQRVIQKAIGKLPPYLQPIARKLAQRLPFLKEFEEESVEFFQVPTISEISAIQYEFNQQVANVLFAPTEVEQDREVAEALMELQVPDVYPIAELDQARERFVEKLLGLQEGEDATPHVENFVPAILPALRLGIRLAGRKRVVGFLARLVGKLIGRILPRNYRRYAGPLSKAVVDTGLRLLGLEVTPENEQRVVAEALAATVEETVRRVVAAPDFVLDDPELLEGFVLEAFEQASADNFPPVLSEETYRKRPDLATGKRLGGMWVMGRRKPYKKFSLIKKRRLRPFDVAHLETLEGGSVEQFLEEELGILPGEEVEASVHLYEALPGTRLADIALNEEHIPKANGTDGPPPLHPLTREAAALLLDAPELGQEDNAGQAIDPHTPQVGQRFYYLEIPGRRLLTVTGPDGRTKRRRPTRLRLILDFPKNEIRTYLFLSEIRAQEVAVKLRQRTHTGMVAARLSRIIERGLHRALRGTYGRLKIIHEAVTPDQFQGARAFRRLPSLIPQVLLGRLREWVTKALSDQLKQHAEEFIKAAEDTADGVTVVVTLTNPPGFPQLRQALKGKALSLASLKLADGSPAVTIKILPGYVHE